MLFTQIDPPSEIWKKLIHELNRGFSESDHPFRFVNLGTLGEKGPEVRTVVLREFEKVMDFYIFTDFRSEKVSEVRANPSVTLHFYHPEKRVQIRVKAKAEIHHQDLVSEAFWSKIEGDAQKAYRTVLNPGIEIKDPEEAFLWPEEMDDRYFTVLRFIPESIEALQLNRLRHLKILFTKKNGWKGQWLVP